MIAMMPLPRAAIRFRGGWPPAAMDRGPMPAVSRLAIISGRRSFQDRRRSASPGRNSFVTRTSDEIRRSAS